MKERTINIRYTLYQYNSYPITCLGSPWGLQEFDATRISRRSEYERGKVVNPTHWPPLTPKGYSWY